MVKDNRPEAIALLQEIKANLADMQKLHNDIEKIYHFDGFYRFYHQSFKVYGLQSVTLMIVDQLRKLSPLPFNDRFQHICSEGTSQKFDIEKSNRNWLQETRPIIEAYTHAKLFLEAAIKSSLLEDPPSMLSDEWAVVLYLFNLR